MDGRTKAEYGRNLAANQSNQSTRTPTTRHTTRHATRARLGHYIKRLESRIAHYMNLTDASWVQNSHSPFAELAGKNEKLRTFFREAFTGQPAEEPLRFRAEGNWYEVPR